MDVDFEIPGPGQWNLDRSHFPGGTTPIMQSLLQQSIENAFREQWPLHGIPAETMSVAFVNGFMYTRLRPLVLADRPSSKPPPTFLLKILTRIHPEFRRRTKAAEITLTTSPARAVIQEWHQEIRPRLASVNLDFQDIDLSLLDNEGLGDHFNSVLTHLRSSMKEHFRLHGYDLGPLGMLLVESKRWGLEGPEVLEALVGASPSTKAPLESLFKIKTLLEKDGVTPETLEDIKESPAASAELDSYLKNRGSVLYAGYDLDTPTLKESPEILLATILAATDSTSNSNKPLKIAARLRERVPIDERLRFDEILHDAREAMDLRDDNGPITSEWPCGLLRLTMLEISKRLKSSAQLLEESHIFCLTATEITNLLTTDMGPTSEEISEREKNRIQQKLLDPPLTLGPPETPPPTDALPAPLATTVTMVQVVINELGMDGTQETESNKHLMGIGIGEKTTTGIARVAENAEEAMSRLQPGEILVTRATSPAYNLVLTLVGGLITAEGGAMSHAAVLSRELEIPAVIGVAKAMTNIEDGDIVEIDSLKNSVTIKTKRSESN
ncbi:MAG TPA: PEP-utilizing enzyme [Acidimicrobiales bacterium]|nr:PEP-utilizing enzyme [Acidimicrobiales bacterium]